MTTHRELMPNMSGRSRLTAWEPGLLPVLMQGMKLDLHDAIRFGLKNYRDAILHENEVNNLIVSAGKYVVGDILIGAQTANTSLTYHAIGTGTNAPAVGDTQLQTEYIRSVFASRGRAGLVMYFDVFYTAAQANIYIKECGVFGGTATIIANSGTLFSHYLQAYDNATNQADLTFEYQLTLA
jgi:hypothetical protein